MLFIECESETWRINCARFMAQSRRQQSVAQDKGAVRLKSISHKAKQHTHTHTCTPAHFRGKQSKNLSNKTNTHTHRGNINCYLGSKTAAHTELTLGHINKQVNKDIYYIYVQDIFRLICDLGSPVLINLKLTLFWDLKASFRLL